MSEMTEITMALHENIKPITSKAEHTRENVTENPEYVIVPKTMKLESLKPILDEYAIRPERKKGVAELHSLASYCEHFNRFKNEHSASFLDIPNARVIGVMDYHQSGNGHADFCQHLARFDLELSPEWRAWKAIHEEPMEQLDFANFLEDRFNDIYNCQNKDDIPKGFDMLDMKTASPTDLINTSKALAFNVDKKVVSKMNLHSGETEMVFTEEHKTSDEAEKAKIPNCFVIAIPVFRGEAAYKLMVRLRYRVRNASVKFICHIHRMDLAYLDAIDDIYKHIQTATERQVFKGKPE